MRLSVFDGTGTHTLTYNDDATLASATAPYIVDHSVNYTYDTQGRRSAMQLKNGNTAVFSHNYTYDAMSRLATVGNGSVTATYSRVPGSSAIASTVINNGSTNVMTTARTYDNKSRLTGINSTAGATSRGYNYQYDDKDQRIKCTFADGSFWEYAYDDKGQVTGGTKKDASGKAMPGQSFGYAYDDIGNRLSEQRGMPEMLFSYAANNLNQYTQRTVPGIIPVTGSAATDATVKVRLPATNSVFNTVRDGVYYKAAVPVENTASGSETNLEIHAVKFDTAQDKDIVKTITGKYWVDKTPQLFTYDLDGNMLFDGKWNSTWDGENRLLSSTNTANTQKLEYAYDYQSRRVSKKVYTKTAADIVWTLAKTEKFMYDGWNVIAGFNADNAMQKSMLWGEDLSGSMQGAGGVGGLLAETNATGTYLPGYDGNGNIMTYLNAADQALVAEYVYDAFGRTLIKSGILADAFVYRFSTKPLDVETGLYYYGYRYYSADMGKWLSRDPMGEKGGVDIYMFVVNNAITRFDRFGLIANVDYENGNIPEQANGLITPLRDVLFGMEGDAALGGLDLFKDLILNSSVGGYAGISIPLTKLMVFYIPPYFTIEVKAGMSGNLECCRKKDSRIGLMFVGKVELDLSAGAGTIIGGKENIKLGRGQKITYHNATGPNRGKFTTNPFDGTNRPSKGGGVKSLPECYDGLNAEVALMFRIEAAAGSGFEQKYKIGSAKWPEGTAEWKFEAPETKIKFGMESGLGIRVSLAGNATANAALIVK